jgi:hypothetical protein
MHGTKQEKTYREPTPPISTGLLQSAQSSVSGTRYYECNKSLPCSAAPVLAKPKSDSSTRHSLGNIKREDMWSEWQGLAFEALEMYSTM